MSDETSNHDQLATPQGSLPLNGGEGMPDMRLSILGLNTELKPISSDGLRNMLADACKFLWQVARITSCVLDTVRLGDIRKVCAEEMPYACGTVREDGQWARFSDYPETQQTPPEQPEPERKPARKVSHPLMALIRFGIQAARLMKQIAAGIFPEAMNVMDVANKLELEQSRLRRFEPYMT